MVIRALRKDDSEESLAKMEREQRVLALYARVDEMMEATESYVEEIRQEMEEKLARMDAMIREFEEHEREELRGTLRQLAKGQAVLEEAPEDVAAPEEPSRNEMRAEALRMAREGMDVGEIAAALGYSKGEVSFMLKLGPQDMQYGKK